MSALPRSAIVATYPYFDTDGVLSYEVVRYEPKDFRQRRSDDRGGWVWSIAGLTPLPYRLPQTLKTIQRGGIVFKVEGEKDSDNLSAALNAAGINATATTANGGASNWKAEQSSHLTGATVVIIPDNDKPGHDGAIIAARALRAAEVASLKWIDLPEWFKDVSDYLEANGSIAELMEQVEQAEEYYPPAEQTVSFPRTVAPRQFAPNDKADLWAQNELDRYVGEMARQTDGRRHGERSVNSTALILGSIAAHGLLTRNECYNAVRCAAESNGSFGKYGQGWFEAEFRSGYEDGLKEPRKLPDYVKYRDDSKYAYTTKHPYLYMPSDITCHTGDITTVDTLPSLADELATIHPKPQSEGKPHLERVHFEYIPDRLPSSLAELSPRYIPEAVITIIDVLITEHRPLTHRELIELTGLAKPTYYRYVGARGINFVSSIKAYSLTCKSDTPEKLIELVDYAELLEVLRQNFIIPRLYTRMARKKRLMLPEATAELIQSMSGISRNADHVAIAETVNSTLDPLLTEAERTAQATLWGDVLKEVDILMERLDDWCGTELMARPDRVTTAALEIADRHLERKVNQRKLSEATGLDRRTIKGDLAERDYHFVPAYAYHPITSFSQLPSSTNKRHYDGKPQRVVIYTLEDEHADPDNWRWIEDGHIPRRDWSKESITAALGDGNRKLDLECRTESILKHKSEMTDEDWSLIERESNAAKVGAKNRVSTQRESKPSYADMVKANYLERAPSLAAVLPITTEKSELSESLTRTIEPPKIPKIPESEVSTLYAEPDRDDVIMVATLPLPTSAPTLSPDEAAVWRASQGINAPRHDTPSYDLMQRKRLVERGQWFIEKTPTTESGAAR